MFAREAPGYSSGFIAIVVCLAASILVILALRCYLIWENKKRDSQGELPAIVEIDGVQVPIGALNLLDKTDRELHQFRYIY